jgi:antitoxin component YwqK of YwqJK toxin-antitoxin module
MERYIYKDLIKFVISDYVDYYILINIPSLHLNKNRSIFTKILHNKDGSILDIGFDIIDYRSKLADDDSKILIIRKLEYEQYICVKVDNKHIIKAYIKPVKFESTIMIENHDTAKYKIYSLESPRGVVKKYKSIEYIKYKVTTTDLYGDKLYIHNLNGCNEYDGKQFEYHNNLMSRFHHSESIKTINNYKNGKLEGLQIKYYSNGHKANEYTIINEMLQGLFIQYNDKGNITSKDYYLDNNKN